MPQQIQPIDMVPLPIRQAQGLLVGLMIMIPDAGLNGERKMAVEITPATVASRFGPETPAQHWLSGAMVAGLHTGIRTRHGRSLEPCVLAVKETKVAK